LLDAIRTSNTKHANTGPLTVLFFGDTYRPYVSGVVTSMDIYAAHLRALGHKVIIVAPEYPDTPAAPGVFRLPSLPFPGYPRLRLITPVTRQIIGQLEDMKPDIIHTHSPFAVGFLGLYIARAVERPVVFTCHSYYEEYLRYLPGLSQPLKVVVRKYLTNYCTYCDLVVAPSPHLRDFLVDIGVEAPVQVLPTGIDPAAVPIAVSADGQNKLRGEDGSFVFAMLGRVAKEKTPDLALLTLFELASRSPANRDRWRLLVIGDGPELERLKRLAVELGVKSLVTFMGEVPRDKVFQALRLADAMIFTSTVETQGLAMLEGMAAGLPLVAADSPAVRALLEDGVTGFAVPSDPAAMAAALARLADDRDLAARVGARGRERCGEFHPAMLAAQLSGQYHALLARGVTPAVVERHVPWFDDVPTELKLEM